MLVSPHPVILVPLLAPRAPPPVAGIEGATAEFPLSFADYMARRGNEVAAQSPAPVGVRARINQLKTEGAKAIARREALVPLMAQRMKPIYSKREGAEAIAKRNERVAACAKRSDNAWGAPPDGFEWGATF